MHNITVTHLFYVKCPYDNGLRSSGLVCLLIYALDASELCTGNIHRSEWISNEYVYLICIFKDITVFSLVVDCEWRSVKCQYKDHVIYPHLALYIICIIICKICDIYFEITFCPFSTTFNSVQPFPFLSEDLAAVFIISINPIYMGVHQYAGGCYRQYRRRILNMSVWLTSVRSRLSFLYVYVMCTHLTETTSSKNN